MPLSTNLLEAIKRLKQPTDFRSTKDRKLRGGSI